MKKQKLHYAWIIAAALFFIQCGTIGILVNCRGMFHSPVCSTFGFELGDFTIYTAFYGIAVVLATPIAAKIIPKCNLPLTIFSAVTLLAASEFCQSYYSELWHWYLSSALQGVLHAIIYSITVGVLVKNWFSKKQGIVLGVIGIASGFSGAILNIVCDSIIASYGWQFAYRFLGVLIFLLMAPVALLLRFDPKEKGLKPYGYEEGEREAEVSTLKSGVPAAAALRSGALWMFLISVACICILTCVNQFVKDYAMTLGYSSAFAASLVSVALVGDIVFKLLVGDLIDRIGFYKAQLFTILSILLSALLLPIPHVAALYVSSFLMGASMAAGALMNPVWTLMLFGDLDYVKIYSWGMLANGFFGAFGFTISGFVVGKAGYGAFLALCIGLGIVALVSFFFSFSMGKKLPRLTVETRE